MFVCSRVYESGLNRKSGLALNLDGKNMSDFVLLCIFWWMDIGRSKGYGPFNPQHQYKLVAKTLTNERLNLPSYLFLSSTSMVKNTLWNIERFLRCIPAFWLRCIPALQNLKGYAISGIILYGSDRSTHIYILAWMQATCVLYNRIRSIDRRMRFADVACID